MQVLVTLCLFAPSADAARCGRIDEVRPKLRDDQLTSIWYAPIEFGNHEKYIVRTPEGVRHIVALESEHSFERKHQVLNTTLHSQAEDDAGAYYGRFSVDLGSGKANNVLFSLNSPRIINGEINSHMKVVWKTYLKEGTVTSAEIKIFKAQEKALVPQRKVSFVITETQTGKTVGFMRVYDGTPFPTYFFGALGSEFEFKPTDPRVPIEKRYPRFNFRKETEYIFEAGRLAKGAEVDHVLEREFHSFGQYLHEKYGYLKTAPKDYWKGRVLIEITGRNLEKFLKPRKDGGYGFTMLYRPRSKRKADQKYVLYCTVADFISNFYTPITEVVTADYYQNFINNPPQPQTLRHLILPGDDGSSLHVFGSGASNFFDALVRHNRRR